MMFPAWFIVSNLVILNLLLGLWLLDLEVILVFQLFSAAFFIPVFIFSKNLRVAIVNWIITVLGLIVFPFFLVWYGYLLKIKHTQRRDAERKHGKDVEFVTGRDSMWALEKLDTENNPMHITSLTILEGILPLDKLRRLVQTDILDVKNGKGEHRFNKLKQYMTAVNGYYAWLMEKDFRVSDHVFRLTEKNQVVTYDTEEELAEIIAKYYWKPFEHGKSPWEMIIIEKTKGGDGVPATPEDTKDAASNSGDQSAVLFRVHHTLGDGVSFVRMIIQCLFDNDIKLGDIMKIPNFTQWDIIMAHIWSALFTSFTVTSSYMHYERNELHGPKLSGKKHFLWSNPIKIDHINEIKNSTKSKLNDIFMSCMAGSIHKYLTRKQSSGQSCDVIHTVNPVALHSPGEDFTLENRFSPVSVQLPTGYMSTLKRLKVVRKNFSYAKSAPDILVNFYTSRMFCNVVPDWISNLFFDSSNLATMVSSNVPGPKTIVGFLGHKVQRALYFVPQRGTTGLGVSFFTYGGHLTVGVMVDMALIKERDEAQQIITGFQEELNTLSQNVKKSYLNTIYLKYR